MQTCIIEIKNWGSSILNLIVQQCFTFCSTFIHHKVVSSPSIRHDSPFDQQIIEEADCSLFTKIRRFITVVL